MSDLPASENTVQPISQADAELIRKLNSNPILSAQIRQLIDQFEAEVGAGMDAHEAEELAIAQLQDLGKALLGQWAESTHEKTLTQAQQKDSSLIKNGKKNSSGTAPSEPSG